MPADVDYSSLDILFFCQDLYNQLLKIKYAFNLETLIYIWT